MLQEMFQKYPILIDIFMAMGILRLIFKPTLTFLLKYVDRTVTLEDDRILKKFMNSKTYLVLEFLLDLTASIKVPKIKDK